MALGNLGLEMEAYICDQGTDTHAIFARGRGCLVLAFRGTLSSKNMLTDLNMGQVALPSMQMRKKPYQVTVSRADGWVCVILHGDVDVCMYECLYVYMYVWMDGCDL